MSDAITLVFTPLQATAFHEGVEDLMSFLEPTQSDSFDQDDWDTIAEEVTFAAAKIPTSGGTATLSHNDVLLLQDVALRLAVGLEDEFEADFPSNPDAARQVLDALTTAGRTVMECERRQGD